jgi:hypothetical protein
MAAGIDHVRGHNEAIELLIRLKKLVGINYRNGYLVARWGVNKSTLYRYAKKLDGV